MTILGRVLTFTILVLLLYISGAITARVLYLKGVLRDGSSALSLLETVFTPLDGAYSRSPIFKAGFDWCVARFTPKEKSEE